MARVYVLKETSVDETHNVNEWTLWFQWCRYVYDNEEQPQYGYRFIWRRPEDAGGSLQAARGQARIPSLRILELLVAKAKREGWGHYDAANFPNAFTVLWASIDDVLDPKFNPEQRRIHIRAFIKNVAFGNLSLYQFEGAVIRISIGGAYGRGDLFKNAQELFQALNDEERSQLKAHFLEKVKDIENEFPDLVQEFPGQFRK